MDHKVGGTISPPDNVWGAVMNSMSKITKKPPELLDVVALLDDLPDQSLASGQVGTVVEILDSANMLEQRASKWNHLRSVSCSRFKVLEHLLDGQLTVRCSSRVQRR
jgi:hypothetical protein